MIPFSEQHTGLHMCAQTGGKQSPEVSFAQQTQAGRTNLYIAKTSDEGYVDNS